jgi:hypothetical protein
MVGDIHNKQTTHVFRTQYDFFVRALKSPDISASEVRYPHMIAIESYTPGISGHRICL